MKIGLWRDCRGRENARKGALRRCLLVAVTFWWAGHWGFCMRKRQRGQRSAKGPASGRPTRVRASTLMATRKGRPMSRSPRKRKPFLAFRRERLLQGGSLPHANSALLDKLSQQESEVMGKKEKEKETNTSQKYGEKLQGRGTPPRAGVSVPVTVFEAQQRGDGPPIR